MDAMVTECVLEWLWTSKLAVGTTTSPRILTDPAMELSQLLLRGFGAGGTIPATGSPERVTRIGLRALRISAGMPRHLALNSEIATSFMVKVIPWSMTMVDYSGFAFQVFVAGLPSESPPHASDSLA